MPPSSLPPTEPQPPVAPAPAPGPVVSPSGQGDYEFIFNPQQPKQRLSINLPGSPIVRVVYISGILLVLLIIANVIRGNLSKGNFVPYVGIAQEQQAMIHIVDDAAQQTNLSSATQNFAATAQLSLISSRDAMGQYLLNNHQKVDAKTLVLKISASTDQELSNAATAGTYDQTFQSIMKNKLNAYVGDLKTTYLQTKGKKGHALLNDDYDQAQLLLVQLGQAANQPQ